MAAASSARGKVRLTNILSRPEVDARGQVVQLVDTGRCGQGRGANPRFVASSGVAGSIRVVT